MRRSVGWKVVGAVLALCAAGAVAALAAQAVIFEGKPAFKEGRDHGYYIWKDGQTWRVRWLTMGARRHFTGVIRAEGGELTSLKRIDVETERRVVAPGRTARVVPGPRGRPRVVGGRAPIVATRDEDLARMDGPRVIRFNARTDDDVDGFDFKVEGDVRALMFDLQVDGASPDGIVEVGRNNQRPGKNPFNVQLR